MCDILNDVRYTKMILIKKLFLIEIKVKLMKMETKVNYLITYFNVIKR